MAPGTSNGVIGFRLQEALHRRQTHTVRVPGRTLVGESTGRFTHRWMLMPDEFAALPDREPPPTLLDPSRSQRFVMLDSVLKFGDSTDGFRGFGTGKTFPANGPGQSQLVATIGTILEGFGKFANHEGAVYLHCGSLSPRDGFIGNLSLRVTDPQGILYSTERLSDLIPQPECEAGITYLCIRGQAQPTDIVQPRLGPEGQFLGLKVEQGLRALSLDYTTNGIRGCRSLAQFGTSIGLLSGNIVFDPKDPRGTTPLNPIPFTTYNTLTFKNREGSPIGSFDADLIEGRVFYVEIPGAPGTRAIRFGGFGPLKNGLGLFHGIEGMMTDNSLVNFTPHVSASIYSLRIHDPDGKFGAALSFIL